MWNLFYISLLSIFAMLDALHGEIYLERENEGNIRRRCRPALGCFPSQLEWAELENNMTGTLVWPVDSFNYITYNSQYNLRKPTFPIVHVVCKNVKDIQMAVRFAKKHNLRVTIKSTGIDVWGKSSAHSSFCINLKAMKHISIKTEATDRSEHGEVTVQTGVLSWTLAEEVVLADGRLATCTHNQTIIEENGTIKTRNDGELFWALRGGGGGTFGIVEHYVLKLHPVQESYVEVNIRIPLHRNASDATIIKRGIEAYDQWVRTVPPYWGGAIAFFKDVLFARIFKHGPWNANTESELRPFYDLESYYDQLLQITNVSIAAPYLVADPYKNARLFQIGGLVPPDKHISTGLRDLLTYEVMDDRNGRLFCYFYRLGGKTLEYDVTSSSVQSGFRRALSKVGCSFVHFCANEGERIEPLAAQLAEKLRLFHDGQDFNAGYLLSPNWKMDFWGEHYADLLKVKIRYDPDNLFTCYHCVESDRTDFDDMFESTSATTTERLPNPLLLLFAALIYMF